MTVCSRCTLIHMDSACHDDDVRMINREQDSRLALADKNKQAIAIAIAIAQTAPARPAMLAALPLGRLSLSTI